MKTSYPILVVAGLALMNSLPGQSSGLFPLVQNPEARTEQVLDGTWDRIVDPYLTGYLSYHSEVSEWGFFRDDKAQKPSDLVEYSFADSPKLKVPGDWNTQDEQLFLYEGNVWYRRLFEVDPDSDARYFLYFGAANYEAMVFLNGRKLGQHTGGFTPFNFEVTGLLKEGRNVLVVKVDDTRKPEGVPNLITDWWNYGGITRSVRLLKTPEAFIRDYFVQLDPDHPGQLLVRAEIEGKDSAGGVRLEIPELGLEEELEVDADGRAEASLPVENVTYWTPEQPHLYEVALAAGEDRIGDQIGLRTIEVRGQDILLNGKPVFLRGVCIHEESPMDGGRVTTEDEARTLLGWAKDLNCNFVRLAHYPHNSHMTRLADRMGLLVWSEIPVYWAIQWENPETFENARSQLEEMISRDHNRASIILWSIANETPVNGPRLDFLSRLAGRAREMDPTRLITAALNAQSVEGKTLKIDDPLSAVVDVMGFNSYLGWYTRELADEFADMKWVNPYNKPLIMSEFGAGALQGYHGTKEDRWTEEFQANVYVNNLEMIRGIESLRGTSPWILKDFRSPRRMLPHIQDFWNRKGLVSDRGIRKQAFRVMREFYEEMEAEWEAKPE